MPKIYTPQTVGDLIVTQLSNGDLPWLTAAVASYSDFGALVGIRIGQQIFSLEIQEMGKRPQQPDLSDFVQTQEETPDA